MKSVSAIRTELDSPSGKGETNGQINGEMWEEILMELKDIIASLTEEERRSRSIIRLLGTAKPWLMLAELLDSGTV